MNIGYIYIAGYVKCYYNKRGYTEVNWGTDGLHCLTLGTDRCVGLNDQNPYTRVPMGHIVLY